MAFASNRLIATAVHGVAFNVSQMAFSAFGLPFFQTDRFSGYLEPLFHGKWNSGLALMLNRID